MPSFQQQPAEQALSAGRNVAYIDEATTLQPDQQTVIVNPGAAAYTITLPPMEECVNKFFFFYCDTVRTSSGSTDLKDFNGGTIYTSSDNFEAVADYLLIFCSGINWFEVTEAIA